MWLVLMYILYLFRRVHEMWSVLMCIVCLFGRVDQMWSVLMYIVYIYLDVLISHAGRLITGSSGHSVKMWSVVGVEDMRLPGRNNTLASQGLTMDDEMNLDGAIVSAAFDDTMDLVGKTIACQHFEQNLLS